jgi:hypothetical protein
VVFGAPAGPDGVWVAANIPAAPGQFPEGNESRETYFFALTAEKK